MSRDGSGSYSRPVADYVFNTVIDETKVNLEMDQIATALTDSIAKDGQTNPSANLPMNSFKHTGVAAGTARDDYADVASIQDGDYYFGGDGGGTADVITLSLSPAISDYADGMRVWFITSAANTGAVTLNSNSVGAKAVVDSDGNALTASAWGSGVPVCVMYEAGNDHFLLCFPTAYISPGDGKVHIGAGLAGSVTANANGDELIVESDQTNMGATFLGGTASVQRIYFGDTDSANKAYIEYSHDADRLQLVANGTSFQIRSDGTVWPNGGDSSSADLRVRGAGGYIFATDASELNAGMGTASPDASALLDLVSTTKGLGLPSMTTTQRNNISTPRDGLLIYNSTSNAVNGRINGSWESLDVGAMQLTRETAQASTSGTSIDFTSLPAGANRITVIFDSVSLDGTDNFLVQIGDSGGLETSSYTSTTVNQAGTGASSSSGFIALSNAAANIHGGHMVLTRIDGNKWVESHVVGITGSSNVATGDGVKALSAELDRLSIVATGSDTFDNGQINVFVEV